MPVCRESPSFPHASFEELPTPPPDLKAPAPGLAPLLVRDDTHTAWRIEWVTQKRSCKRCSPKPPTAPPPRPVADSQPVQALGAGCRPLAWPLSYGGRPT